MPARTDGRVLRGTRNRDAVVDAFVALLEEGDLRPTAPRVAERAGVSLRSVFHHFADMEALLARAAESHAEHYRRAVVPLATTGPLDSRITAFVEQRARVAELVLPVYRAALLGEQRSALIARKLATSVNASRTELTRVFAPELRRTDRSLVEALDALTSLDGWVRLRVRQDLSPARAKRVLHATLTALL